MQLSYILNASTRTALVSPVENGRITSRICSKLFIRSVCDSFMFSITLSGLQLRVRNKNIFSYFSTKIYVVGTPKNCLNETVLSST